MNTVQQAYVLAVQHHQAGRLAEAEALYRQVLAQESSHAEALHFLGVIASQMSRHDLAIGLIEQAISHNPKLAAAHFHLGEAYRASKRLADAIAAYERAAALQPSFPDVHYSLGLAFIEQGERGKAIAAYRQALALRPNYPQAYNNLGAALAEEGRYDEAVAACREALRLNPNYGLAECNLGQALVNLGSPDDAVLAYQRALLLNPRDSRALSGLAGALRTLGRLDDAVAAFRGAAARQPDDADTLNNLGTALVEQGNLSEAVNVLRRALKLRPNFAMAHSNLGFALTRQGHLDDAILALTRALEIKPDYPNALNLLGNALKHQGRLDESLEAYRRALRLKPHAAALQSNLIYTLHYHPAQDLEMIAREEKVWSRRFCEPMRGSILPHTNDPDPDRPLRVGYVSPDFREHIVGRNLLPLFQYHERQLFEVVCYADVEQADTLTRALRKHATGWRETSGLSNDALAAQIREDRIDILVDASQHMAGNRLLVFARQPAPVQVSFAGYPASAGVETIRYRISDRWLEEKPATGSAVQSRTTPSGLSEQLYLMDNFWCYDPFGLEILVGDLPARRNGFITFGSLNNFCKVNDSLLRLWTRVLKKLPASRLLLLSPQGSHRQRTVELLQAEGVDSFRVEFAAHQPRQEYLELYHSVDLVLDTYPYNGHTTSLDALWMGVPVVSLAGKSPVSRAGLSQLSNLGLSELVAHDEENYVRIAAGLAKDLDKLTELRATLRRRMEASVLMDGRRFARDIEAAYRAMWRQWCAGAGTPTMSASA